MVRIATKPGSSSHSCCSAARVSTSRVSTTWSAAVTIDRSLSEGLLLFVHAALYVTVVFWVLSPLMAVAFIAVHQAVFSLYLGCSFAPNHKGMPVLEDGTEMSFARRQVITARNLSGGRWRGSSSAASTTRSSTTSSRRCPGRTWRGPRSEVRAFCAENHLGYAEASPIASYVQVVSSLRVA